MKRLKGSCHCGAVHFSLSSTMPYPYQRCYCSICRKTQGGGGYVVNIGGDATSLKVKGRKNISIYHARLKEKGDKRAHRSTAERHFCKKCGSGLWLFSPEWPEWVHPFASAIDSALPVPPEYTDMMLDFKASWVELPNDSKEKKFGKYPQESLADWHTRHGL